MSSTYRRIFLEGLEKLYASGKIQYHESYEEVHSQVCNLRWVVHNTHPTIDTRILGKYLSRYINRIAISNSKVEWLKISWK